MKKVRLCDLVIDFNLYPRRQVDKHHVGEMREARKAGAEFPPIVIDKASSRVIDGFHRRKMYLMDLDEKTKVEVIAKNYADEAEMFLDAMRYNAEHGRNLTKVDKVHCALVAQQLSIDPEVAAAAMHITHPLYEELVLKRVGTNQLSEPVALKRTIRHMAGRKLTKGQEQANEMSSGMPPSFYCNQLISLLENDLVDWTKHGNIKALNNLRELLLSVEIPQLHAAE